MKKLLRYVRAEDFVWLLLFSAMAAISPERDATVLVLLGALGLVQVLEPRMGPVASVLLKLGFCFVLLGYSGGISSSFYMILLLPVISASTEFGARGTALATAGAAAVYLSFLLFLDWQTEFIPEDQLDELVLRVLFLPVVGFLTYQLAASNREETRKLAAANDQLREMQAEVRRTERLAALGQLTAGLAHELRNPLGTVKSSAEMLQKQVDPDGEISRELAGFISAEVDRINSLITRFLEFARPQHLRREKGSVAALLDRAIERFETEYAASSVSIYKNYSPDVAAVRFDAELMERAILNLLPNAAQASPPGGTVTVKTRPAAEGGAEISVIDRGSGIEPAHLESVFNPFFTTKAEGVGLGLAIVSKIVDEHGGQVQVESKPGEGTVFRVYLPA